MEATADDAVAPRPTRRLLVLIPGDGREPAPGLDDREAEAAWAAVSAPWHPAVLARVGALPSFGDPEVVAIPDAGDVLILPEGAAGRMPADFRARAEGAGAVVVEGPADRLEMARRILGHLDPDAPAEALVAESDAIAADFLALGTARWMLRDLTNAMGHLDCLDHESLAREALDGARAHRDSDAPGATNRLRAAFELLTQARERFYPVDAYVVDLVLLDPTTPPGALADALAARSPFTVLGPASAVQAQAGPDPAGLAALREAIAEGWADVVGGVLAEADEPLLPLESIVWQFRRGSESYRLHLDDRNVETLARRRFGLYPQLPQVARRFGFRFALHLGLDAGLFPVRPESKRLWEAPDGTSLEAMTRPPMAADRPSEGRRLPWQLARTMKDDHVATLPLAHWPRPVAGWYRDLRRVSAYSPVLARWVTLSDYFHLTDRPYEIFRTAPDEYLTPYLSQAVARRDPFPISRRARHARLRARLDAQDGLTALAAAIAPTTPEPEAAGPSPEDALESGRFDEADRALDDREPALAEAVARAVVGSGTSGRPGFLVLNPIGIARRAAVLLPDASPDLRPEGPLLAAQETEEGVWAVVDLPAFGYAWVPRESSGAAPPAPLGVLSAQDRTLRNESIEVQVDPATGGIRGVHARGEDVARVGQQLVVTGLEDGPSRMRATSFVVDRAGPALLQAESVGELTDASGRRLVTFRQRFRLWTGRPLLELDVTLSDPDPAWLDRAAGSDPWAHHLACRWAWPDPRSSLRRLALLHPWPTTSERPETPDAIDIATRLRRSALIFGGLAHHRRHGPRMLDTLLIAGLESARSFRLGVALDLEHPHQASSDRIAPAFVVPTLAGPPRPGPSGWFFALDHPAVAVTRVAPLSAHESEAPALAFHLVETSGQPARCRLRLVRDPAWARQVDFTGSLVADLPVSGDAVSIDLTPHEIARVEVTFR